MAIIKDIFLFWRGRIKIKNHIAEHTAMSCRIVSNDPSEDLIKEGRDHNSENFDVLTVFSVAKGATITKG